jgi:CO dehydrogenase/acetyl-CoA synthase epsilon subunit
LGDGARPVHREIVNAGIRAFEIVPLETVSETSSNASIGDLNGDGHPDIVLVKGRHWQVTSRVFFGDSKGHFTPAPALPSKAIKATRHPWRT